MELQKADFQALLDRLEKVEKQNRFLKRAVMALLFLIGSNFFMARAGPGHRVEAEEFVLKDAGGNVRARLEMAGGDLRLTLVDSQRHVIVLTDANMRVASRGSEFGSRDSGAAVVRSASARATGGDDVPRKSAVKAAKTVEPPSRDSERNDLRPGVHRQASIIAPPSSTEQSTGSFSTDGQLRARLAYPNDLAFASPRNRSLFLASEPAPEFRSRVSGPRAERRELPAPIQMQPAGTSRGRAALTSNDLEQKWASVQQQAQEVPRLMRNPFEFARTTVASRAPALPSPVAPAPNPTPAPDSPPPLAPPVLLKAIGYTEKQGGSRQVVISSESSVYVVQEGETFADRFQVLRITPTLVEIQDALTHQVFPLAVGP